MGDLQKNLFIILLNLSEISLNNPTNNLEKSCFCCVF